MSPVPAQSRPQHRRTKSAGLLNYALFGVAVIAVCVYAVWGMAPLQHAWTALGFGKAPIEIAATNVNSADSKGGVSGNPAKSGTGPYGPKPRLPFADADPNLASDESDGIQYLPEKSRRRTTTQRSPSQRTKNSNAELDQRFEADAPRANDEIGGAIQTAEHEEMAPANRPRPKFPKHKRIQFEMESLEDATEQQAVSTSQVGDEDETEAEEKPRTTPSRGGVKAKPASSAPNGTGLIKLPEIQALIDQGQDTEAYLLLATAYTKHPSDRPRFQELLDSVAQRVYFTPQPHLEPPYEIQPGDQLRKIATKYKLSWQYLSKLNQVDAKKIRPGKKLKVFQGPFHAAVDLSDFELTVYLNGKYVKRYKVGIGKDNSSPLGEFTVKEKLENPTYYGPEGNVLAADDPNNPLGERWIDIGNSFGIHGTIDPKSIGKSESAGCIRMKNEDVVEVYDLLTIGSAVSIQR